MTSKLPIKYTDGFFNKIKMFFSNIFNKKTIINETSEEVKHNKVEINSKENEFDKMKTSSNKVKIKEDILTLIDNNPELINTLSIEKLEELDSMYDEIIEENDRKINKLKREIA
jgi:hypothetical protein